MQTNVIAVPFVLTMALAVAISTYMLFDPAPWVSDLMELTYMSISFRGFVLVIAIGGFVVSYVAERYLFLGLAKWIGKTRARLRPQYPKKRKEYKLVMESMRF